MLWQRGLGDVGMIAPRLQCPSEHKSDGLPVGHTGRAQGSHRVARAYHGRVRRRGRWMQSADVFGRPSVVAPSVGARSWGCHTSGAPDWQPSLRDLVRFSHPRTIGSYSPASALPPRSTRDYSPDQPQGTWRATAIKAKPLLGVVGPCAELCLGETPPVLGRGTLGGSLNLGELVNGEPVVLFCKCSSKCRPAAHVSGGLAAPDDSDEG